MIAIGGTEGLAERIIDDTYITFLFQISFFVTAYMLPLLLIICLYSIMLCRLWNQAPGGRASAESIKNKKRVIKMVLIVVVIFALCWLPIHIILVLKAMKLMPLTPVTITMQIISHILAYSNSCVNPILYAFLSEPFRRGFWAVITCIRPSGPHGIQHNGYEMTEAAHNANKAKNNRVNNANNGRRRPQINNGAKAGGALLEKPQNFNKTVVTNVEEAQNHEEKQPLNG